MENSARQLTGGELEETVMSDTGLSSTRDVTCNFHSAFEECNLSSSSLDEVALGDCSSARSSMELKFEYFSARMEEMMQSKSQFSSTVEHEIEHSRVHWTEVSGPSNFLTDEELTDDELTDEEVNQENAKVFTELMNDPLWKHHERGEFFHKMPYWKLGRKIAEGGQAEIFEIKDIDGNVHPEILFKVFKGGLRLSHIKKQWPCGIVNMEVLCITRAGTMFDDGRIAFKMIKCWGDLRKLINQVMQEKNNQGPPFPYKWNGRTLHVKDIMTEVAYYMDRLHKKGIIHKDLKAVNILLRPNEKDLGVLVVDFEFTIGIVGSGFWRSPEILLGLKNRSAIDFSEKVDVYSYSMTCFEIVTGRLPFEGELEPLKASYDLIIEGHRPKLPSDLDVTLKDLIERCWNPAPNEKPTFLEILEILNF